MVLLPPTSGWPRGAAWGQRRFPGPRESMTDNARRPRLTIRGLTARPVLLPLERPVVARIATITEWPIVLIDLETEEGVVGRAYLEPYIPKAMRYLVPALEDLGELLRGRAVVPVDLYEAGRKSLHFVGYEGLSAIAVSGVDMAAWGRAVEGGGPAPVRAPGRVGRPGASLQQQRAVAARARRGRRRGGRAARGGRLRGPEAAHGPRPAARRPRRPRGRSGGGRG